MSYVEEREAALKSKIIPQTKNPDFEEFWSKAVAELRKVPLQVTREKLKTPYDKTFTTYEITFNTHDKTMVHAYFSCPNNAEGKLPCVSLYHGGSGHKRIFANILATGVCCFAMDVRSQGGTTIDAAEYTMGDYCASLMTRGVLDENEFYMKNIYLDAVRAMDVIASLDEVDPGRIVTCGSSQGGALSIVASALSGHSKKCYSMVTSYNCLKQRTEIGSGVFDATHRFLKEYPRYTDTVFNTLTYFDVNNLVSLLNVPTSICLGLTDPICLPEFVYSVYSHISCEKEIRMYPFAPHIEPADYIEYVHNELAEM